MDTVTPEEFKKRMAALYGGDSEWGMYDEEAAHYDADELMCRILCALGYEEGVEIFKQARRWYA